MQPGFVWHASRMELEQQLRRANSRSARRSCRVPALSFTRRMGGSVRRELRDLLSKQFGSKWADALFTSHWMKLSAQEFYRDVKQLAAVKGSRAPEKLLVMPGVYPVLGATETEARQRKADLDDQLDLEYLKGSLASVLGVDAADLDLGRELPYGKIPPA